MIAKSNCWGCVRNKWSQSCSSTAALKRGPETWALTQLLTACCCTAAGAWAPGAGAALGGNWPWRHPLPRGVGSLEHNAGCREGLQHCCLPHWDRPSPLGELGEEPKSSLWVTGSRRWGSDTPVVSWAAQPAFQVNKSISNYRWDSLAQSAALCRPGTALRLLLRYNQSASTFALYSSFCKSASKS